MSHGLPALLFLGGVASAALPPGNLVVNPSGAQAPNIGWDLTGSPASTASTGWVTRPTGGHDTTPGYFVTSYSLCKRSQLIDLVAAGADPADLDTSPEITVSEWISSNLERAPQDTFYLRVELRDANQAVLDSYLVGSQTAMAQAPINWTEYKKVFTGYPSGVRYVYFEDGGIDLGFWAGQYGSYHDDARVQFTLDTDGDGLPDAVEEHYELDKADPTDADGDKDEDGLSNIFEYQNGLDLGNADTDGDGLKDGEEADAGTNALNPDTDKDGLSDGDEVNTYHSDPLFWDSDNDFFPDGLEVTEGSSPTDAASTPHGIKIENLGTDDAALIGGDLTDPEDDAASDTLTGYNFTAITATNNATFASEGAFNLFDNRLSGNNNKWFSGSFTSPRSVTVQFAEAQSLQYFTISSANDAADRDPTIWEIQGSNDGTNFETIYRQEASVSIWFQRNQVLKVTLGTPSDAYTYFRFVVFKTAGSVDFQLGEIEYFGAVIDTDSDGLPDYWELKYPGTLDPTVADADADPDADGLTNIQEFAAGTSPANADTDGDGYTDSEEDDTGVWGGVVAGKLHTGTDPLVADSDGDGIPDGKENPTLPYVDLNQPGTDPNKADSDGDGTPDLTEIRLGSNPTSSASIPVYGAVLSENFDGVSVNSIYAFTKSLAAGYQPAVTATGAAVHGNAGQLTNAGVGNTNNSIAWDTVATQASSIRLTFDYRMSADVGGEVADGFGLGLFKTANYGATGGLNPGYSATGPEINWENPLTGAGFPNAVMFGFDIYGGATEGNTVRLTGPNSTTALASAVPSFQLNAGVFHRVIITGITNGDGSTAFSLQIIRDVDSGTYQPVTLFSNVKVPGFDITTDAFRLISGGRTGGLTVRTEIDNLELATTAAQPAAPLSIISAVLNTSTTPPNFVITWKSEAGANYVVESSATLTSPWTPVGSTVNATGTSASISIPVPAGSPPKNFFRVKNAP